MDASLLLDIELEAMNISSTNQLSVEQLIDLAVKFAVWIPAATYVRAPWLAPFAVRIMRLRSDDHAPGPKRDLWGMPDDRGYFADDNSLLKGIANRRQIGPESGPYHGRRVTKGLVCCHVWSGTTRDPLIFSFVPNLVWLPRQLAWYPDNNGVRTPHALHEALKSISRGRFVGLSLTIGQARAAKAWDSLGRSPASLASSNEISDVDGLVQLVRKRIVRLEELLEASLSDKQVQSRRFSKRYHDGYGWGIDSTVDGVSPIVSETRRRELLVEISDRKPL